ncbi:type VI secretion system tube protein Hcp [Luteolibacter marinus]|uniref:type VI secretion system tube protein Hcp n=1 Tax=Luteolibacter marinus TaxID=2776705 RepID=UPI0018686661|nr:type VI secretion system tube protein Hcp [Luteolibacter marinus]
MKAVLLSLLLSFAGTLCGRADIEAYMRIVGQTAFAEEGVPEELAGQGFFPLGSVEIGVENTVNIGSASGGAGAGRAKFKPLKIRKRPGRVSTDLFKKLVTGGHYDEVEIVLVRGGLAPGAPPSLVMTFGLKMVVAAALDYNVTDGDAAPDEAVELQFGAIRMKNYTYDPQTGESTPAGEEVWSQVLNNATFNVQ